MSNVDRRQGHRGQAPLTLIIVALIGGCSNGAPSGQVVATVEGVDITRRDLSAEAKFGDRAIRSEAAMRGPVLEEVVNRRLLVERGKRLELDRTPDYIAEVRRFRDAALARMVVQRIVNSMPRPSVVEARHYARQHAARFEGRTFFLIDGEYGSSRGRQWIDGLLLSDDDARRLDVTRAGDRVTLDQTTPEAIRLLTRWPAPLVGIDADNAAARLIGAERARGRIRKEIERERRSSVIRYQAGFGPAAR